MSRITVADCRQAVGERFDMPKDVLLSKTRKRSISRKRQMAMVLAYELADEASTTQIARGLNVGDHTTALHAVRRIYDLEEWNFRIANDMEHLRLTLLTLKAQRAVTLIEGAF